MPLPKSEFRNTTGGYIGVQVRGSNGQMTGIAVRADTAVWLDEEEQIATANAPRDDKDNPFEGDPPALELVTAAKDVANRRRIGHTERPQIDDVKADEAAAEEGGGGQPSDAEGAAPAATEEPAAPEPEEKPESEMTEDERRQANAKAAAARAIPPAAAPKPAAAKEAPKPAGAPQGQRAPTETVATPEAEGK